MNFKKQQKFIRFKNIPPNERSGIYDGDLGKIREEIGVSCYDFIEIDGNYKIIIPSISSGVFFDLSSFINDFKNNKIPAFIIEADQIGIGNYGEPLVKNVKIICNLKRVELAEEKPKFKMDRTNPQIRIKKV
jgi:hypothetical protein